MNNEGLTILSLFDGMSCGQIALERAGIKVKQYYASEIDKHAIKVTQHNYPNTIQLGSVLGVDTTQLPKIDLLIGGSPCQSFSFAGKRKGMATKCNTKILSLDKYLELKAEGYEFEGQSYLFWEYMRILNEVKPKYFLLENVEMGEKWEAVLSKAIGVNGIHINSALLSAQNRKRIYWTNIGMKPAGLFGDLQSIIEQPKDKGILLRDILETDVPEKYYLSDKMIEYFNKKAANFNNGKVNIREPEQKSSTLTSSSAICDISDNFVKVTNQNRDVIQLNPNTESGGKQPYQQNRIYDVNGISPAICANKSDLLILGCDLSNRQKRNYKSKDEKANSFLSTSWKGSQANGMTLVGDYKIRRITPTECERLQTVPDGYTSIVSDTQRYKMLGNGWTVDVIAYIFSYMK